MKTDLSAEFQISNYDQEELVLYLSENGHSHHIRKNVVCYLDALEVTFSNRGKILSIEGDPGNALVRNKLAGLDKAMAAGSSEVRMAALFSHAPMRGFFRYQDRFQLFPDPNLGDELYKHPFPFILQYACHGSTCFSISARRKAMALMEIQLLLCVLVEHGIEWTTNSQGWAISLDDPVTDRRSVFVQHTYSFGGLDDFKSDSVGFFEPEAVLPIGRMKYQAYYTQLGIYLSRDLMLPDNFEQSLQKFYELNSEDKERFLRSAYWLHVASATHTLSISTAFQCLVQVVEALVETVKPRQSRCAKEGCTNKIVLGEGPTKSFRDFLDSYTPGLNKKLKEEFYNMRSSITHGDKLFPQDLNGMTAFNPSQIKSDDLYRSLRHVVSVCLYNWLHYRNTKSAIA